MASNFKQPGSTMTFAAPYDVAAGAGMLVGTLFAVAQATAASGASVQGKCDGVWELKKTLAQAWTAYAKLYWDNTAKEVTTVSTSNTFIGCAGAAAANPSSTGIVRLNGISV